MTMSRFFVFAMVVMIVGVCAIDLDHSNERRRVDTATSAPAAAAKGKANAKAKAPPKGTADLKASAKGPTLNAKGKANISAKKSEVKVELAAVPKGGGGKGAKGPASVVRLSQADFAKTLGPVGTELKAVVEKIANAASAVWDDIKGMFRFRKASTRASTKQNTPPAPVITCKFVGAVPGVSDAVLDPPNSGGDELIGPDDENPGRYKAMSGPAMYHQLYAGRNHVNCYSDKFIRTVTKQGSARWDIGFVCTDEAGMKAEKPDTCKVTIVGEGIYKGYAYAIANSDYCTWSSWFPGIQENKVAFGCNDEVQFDFGSKTIFAKAARFQRGNSLTTTRESSIEAKIGADSDGLAGDIGVKFGKTVSETQTFDPAETYILGTGRSDPVELNNAIPSVTMQLTTQATVFSNSESRVWGTAIASSSVGGMWYYGHASGGCGATESVYGYDYWIYGNSDEVTAAANQAKSFLRSNGINL